MLKQVRFEEVATGKLISLDKEAPAGQRPMPGLLPRKHVKSGTFYQNKIYYENADHMVPIRAGALDAPLANPSESAGPSAPLLSPIAKPRTGKRQPPYIAQSLSEQRIVYPEPAKKPKADIRTRYAWSEGKGTWTKQTSYIGVVLNKVMPKTPVAGQ